MLAMTTTAIPVGYISGAQTEALIFNHLRCFRRLAGSCRAQFSSPYFKIIIVVGLKFITLVNIL